MAQQQQLKKHAQPQPQPQPQPQIHREVTRATRFQKKFVLPQPFSKVLKDFTREVLREQPKDIYAFGASYFRRLALKEDGVVEVQPPKEASSRRQLSPEEREKVGKLQTQLYDAFKEEDHDSCHRLHPHIIKRVLKMSCNLTMDQCVYLISTCTGYVDLRDGSVDYGKFVTENVQIIFFFMTSNYQFPKLQHADDVPVVHGLRAEEVETRLMHLFQSRDQDGTGRITLEVFNHCLRTAPLQLTQRDITLLTLEAVVVEANFVQYSQEAALAFELLVQSERFERFTEAWLEGKL